MPYVTHDTRSYDNIMGRLTKLVKGIDCRLGAKCIRHG